MVTIDSVYLCVILLRILLQHTREENFRRESEKIEREKEPTNDINSNISRLCELRKEMRAELGSDSMRRDGKKKGKEGRGNFAQ